MRVSLDCRDPELLAAEVRRLRNVISHDHWDAICQEGDRVSREEGYVTMQAEVAALHAECERLRLTQAERVALNVAAAFLFDEGLHSQDEGMVRDAATLRGLLKRCSRFANCESDRSQPIADARLAALQALAELDEELGLVRTPTPHATPTEGSVRTDCIDTGEK